MTFDLRALISDHMGQARRLHDAHANPVFAQVLEMIGFTHEYTGGLGTTLTTLDGRTILDGLSGYGVFGMGRNHPVVKKAIQDAMEMNLPNLVQMDTSLLSGLLAEKLIASAPGDRLEHVFFTNSGTEAVEGAIKFARAATKRNRILYSKGSYHGLSLGSLSVTGDASFREGFGELLPECEAITVEDLATIETQLRTKNVAAVLLEPIRGKGVFFPNDETIYPRIEQLCRETGTLLIMDEIQAGLGRTGRMWASDHWNLNPDVVTTAKALSGGLIPVGALMYSQQVYKGVFSRLDRCVVHSSTFGQNNLAMVAGLATLDVLHEENLIERCAAQGEKLLAGLRDLQTKHEFIRDVRGKGLMIAIEFGSPRSLRLKPAYALLHTAQKGLFAQAVVMQLYDKHNLLTQVSGHQQEIVKLLPAFTISDEEIDHIVQALDDVLTECRSFPGPVWSVGKQLASAAARQQFARA